MGKESLKLFGTHAIISIFIALFAAMILSGVGEFLDWVFTLLYFAFFWVVMLFGIARVGNNDTKRDRFAPWKGFAIGFFVQIPALIVYVVLLMSSWRLQWLLRIWFSPYMKFFLLDKWNDAWMIVFILLFIALAGIGYLFGEKQREKTLKIIEEREQMRAELSKRDSE
jgi:hypothetical protein